MLLNIWDALGNNVIQELKMKGRNGTHRYPIDLCSLKKEFTFILSK